MNHFSKKPFCASAAAVLMFGVLASAQATAATPSSANLAVKGKIAPSACTVSTNLAGAPFNLGDHLSEVLDNTGNVHTGMREVAHQVDMMSLSVDCPSVAIVQIAFTDGARGTQFTGNNSANSSTTMAGGNPFNAVNVESHGFGLGKSGDQKIGFYAIMMKPTSPGEAKFLCQKISMEANSGCMPPVKNGWQHARSTGEPITWRSVNTSTTNLSANKFGMDISLNAYIQNRATLSSVKEILLDGRMVVTMTTL